MYRQDAELIFLTFADISLNFGPMTFTLFNFVSHPRWTLVTKFGSSPTNSLRAVAFRRADTGTQTDKRTDRHTYQNSHTLELFNIIN